jgi:hypothetical protein
VGVTRRDPRPCSICGYNMADYLSLLRWAGFRIRRKFSM